ncbi:PREDICTED: uncharacterized protein LOC108763126, partial [Trachymyrmex cornetzi]|uniref:uncharacterized protein LOC108763126 n=1 Tax=Trachymyrmex cornetzi TaxID=471704 RepID=UPI00084F54D1
MSILETIKNEAALIKLEIRSGGDTREYHHVDLKETLIRLGYAQHSDKMRTEQHAYRAGHSSISALHTVVHRIEKQLQQGGFLIGTFLDIEGAFNNTPHEVVCAEATRRGFPVKLVKWIQGMLGRQVTTSLGT